ncbi:MAG TPA: hypothetical protein VHZ25_11545 [Acidobacteriaceae bacterium]|jgi:hypothetical protein|nr:hypothetical protein [Acidobacteriaceae bacterium]
MEKKSDKQPDVEGLKKQLEAITGEKVDIPDDLIRQLRWPVGAHNYSDGDVLWRSIFFPPGKSCVDANLLDASGSSATGAGGTVTFPLSSVLCELVFLAAPINVQATVRGTTPAFLTMAYALVPVPNSPGTYTDLNITVYTWDASGKPAPNVDFDWRCRVVSLPVIE